MSAAEPPVVVMSRRQWRRLMNDLARRGRGRRESGAFLLAETPTGNKPASSRVRAWIPFDELDPECLNGAISMRSQAFGRLWEICNSRSMRVIADVHTHPGSGVAQSPTDAANPMIAQRGHVAIIVPNFAIGRPAPRRTGIHVYRGHRKWASYFGRDAADRVNLGRTIRFW